MFINMSMPTIGLGMREQNWPMHSKAKRLTAYARTKVMKLSHGKPPMAKPGTHAQTAMASIIGSCTSVVADEMGVRRAWKAMEGRGGRVGVNICSHLHEGVADDVGDGRVEAVLHLHLRRLELHVEDEDGDDVERGRHAEEPPEEEEAEGRLLLHLVVSRRGWRVEGSEGIGRDRTGSEGIGRDRQGSARIGRDRKGSAGTQESVPGWPIRGRQCQRSR